MQNLKEQIEAAVKVFKSGDFLGAENVARKLITNNPKVVFLYNFLGLVLAAQNKIDEAIKFYENGIKIDPNFAMLYNNLGIIYFNLKSASIDSKVNLKKAERLYKKSIELDNKNPEPFTNLGNLYNFLNNYDESIKYHKIAIEANQKSPYPYLNLANVYVAIGNFIAATKYLKEAIKLNNNFIPAHRLLNRIIKYVENDEHLNELLNLYKITNDNSIEDKTNLGFSLGKAFEDIKKYDKSFFYYEAANLCYKKKINFSFEDANSTFKEIKKTFYKELFVKFGDKGFKSAEPIFILGMPRSGTTLIEQIISSHSRVYGADEVEFIPGVIKKYFGDNNINLFLQNIFEFNSSDFKKMGKDYILLMSNLSNNSKRFTDKLPINFLNIGLIKLILPNSKIIHTFRNPKDNVFSIFKNHFTSGKITYAYDLKDIVLYYNLYKDLMKHWNTILPNFILNICYENLIKNTESEIKNLLNFCNLNWEDSCLKFYETKRSIKTASDIQVRSKIYSSSIHSWKNYEKHLNKYYDLL